MVHVEGLRPMRADDAEAIIGLVAAAYAEYPGCVLDLPGVDDDLPVLGQKLRDAGGQGWVVERGDPSGTTEVVAIVGWAPSPHPAHFTEMPCLELKRLYVAATARGAGLGSALVDHVLAVGHDRDAAFVELWSDTRFEDAHRLYERKGFVRSGQTRDLHDPSNTTEYHYLKDLRPLD